LAVTGVYLNLSKKYPEAEWLSERELIQQKYAAGVGKSGHMPDGISAAKNYVIASFPFQFLGGSISFRLFLTRSSHPVCRCVRGQPVVY